MTQTDDLKRARTLFSMFQSRAPHGNEISLIETPARAIAALEVGRLVDLGYRAKGNGNYFRHTFERPDAKVYVSFDGTQIFIVGGGYKFGPKGFIR